MIHLKAQKKLVDSYKIAVGFAGCLLLAVSAAGINSEIFNLRFLGYFIFAILIGLKMDIILPYTKINFSFSDSATYLAFLLYGGETAIVVAGAEIFIACLIGKYRGVKLLKFSVMFNVGAAVLTIGFAYYIWKLLFKVLNLNTDYTELPNLIATLGVLSLSVFFSASFITSCFYGLKNNINPWQVWKNEGYSISLMQIASAAIAGIIYKAFLFENPAPVFIALIIITVAYLSYRRSNKDLTRSIEKAEQAEREKSEAERLRAEQTEKHIKELNTRLAKEEEISHALQQSRDDFEYAAMHDSLTNLFNRSYLIERLKFLLDMGINKSSQYFVLFFDLSQFKDINDSLGHNTGDKVLKLVADRLRHVVNEEDTIARLGGDEFAVILNDLSCMEEAEKYAERIYQKLSAPFSVQGNRIFVKPHVGIAPLDSSYKIPEEILRDADIAMHHAKNKEIGIAFFDKEIRERFLNRISLEADLRNAVERQEFSLHYQPLISLKDGTLVGFEALLRWRHPRRGLVSPGEFIPIAEASGLIIPITDWILQETTHQLSDWQKLSQNYSELMMSVNISGKHLAQDGLVDKVKQVLASSKINPFCLKLEITETIAMEYRERTVGILNKLKQFGVQLSIDDFGTGYSSLSHLHRMPFDNLKIDRSFVSRIGANGENCEILQIIASLAKNLKMQSIAEGIETVAQLQILRALNCDYAQGFLFSKPLPADEIEKLLYQKHCWFPQEFDLQASDFSKMTYEKSENNRIQTH